MHIFINNKFYPEEKAKVSVFEHGLLYGDGVFETLRTYNGKVFKIEEHLNRLFHSANSISLKVPLKKSEIVSAISSAIKKNNLKEAYIRITLTRGIGDIGYTTKCKPNFIIIAKGLVPYSKEVYEKGVSIMTYNAERFLPEVKSINCLALVLAKKKAEENACFEAVLVDNNGNITEGTVSNIFFVKKEKIYTPRENVLCGITREIVIKIAKKSLRVVETKIKKNKISFFDECFLTNTTAEIVPVVKIDAKKINNGFPGDVTKMLMREFRKIVKSR